MTDSEPSDFPSPAPETPGRRPSSTFLAGLALLVALGTAAFVGYRAWQGEQAAASARAALDGRLAALAKTDDRHAGDFAALAAEVESLRQEVAQAQSEHRTVQGLLEQAGEREGPAPSTQSWQVAEADYLLRVANYRVRLEADAAGARQMLAAADQALADADPFAYHEVRALLAKEQAALAAVAGTDVQGIFLRLDALKSQLGQLPLRLPAYVAQEAAAKEPPAAPTMLDAALARLGSLVRFRSAGPPVRPLLPPEQAEYLQLHLRLALNHAQLAALRRDQTVFAASLDTASKWLAAYVDMRHEASRAFAATLDALRTEDLAASLPDVSGSLARLRALRAPTQSESGELAASE